MESGWRDLAFERPNRYELGNAGTISFKLRPLLTLASTPGRKRGRPKGAYDASCSTNPVVVASPTSTWKVRGSWSRLHVAPQRS